MNTPQIISTMLARTTGKAPISAGRYPSDP